mmetsp:Transcript_49859/g.132401  ORF Transcript_49859/g.132401 Transcript_49859/m.132401 type:complete len:355 (-) Transcript_49859:506-1570(-)
MPAFGSLRKRWNREAIRHLLNLDEFVHLGQELTTHRGIHLPHEQKLVAVLFNVVQVIFRECVRAVTLVCRGTRDEPPLWTDGLRHVRNVENHRRPEDLVGTSVHGDHRPEILQSWARRVLCKLSSEDHPLWRPCECHACLDKIPGGKPSVVCNGRGDCRTTREDKLLFTPPIPSVNSDPNTTALLLCWLTLWNNADETALPLGREAGADPSNGVQRVVRLGHVHHKIPVSLTQHERDAVENHLHPWPGEVSRMGCFLHHHIGSWLPQQVQCLADLVRIQHLRVHHVQKDIIHRVQLLEHPTDQRQLILPADLYQEGQRDAVHRVLINAGIARTELPVSSKGSLLMRPRRKTSDD